MQNDQIYSDIANLIATKADLNLMNSELDLLENSLYKTGVNSFDSVLREKVREGLRAIIKEPADLKKVKEYVNQIKFLELTLAVDPTKKTLDRIINWVAETINQRVALDIKIDQSIIGGAVIIFEGKYFDGSVKAKLEKITQNYV